MSVSFSRGDEPTDDAGSAAYLKRLTLLVRDGRIGHTFYPVLEAATHAGCAGVAGRETARGG